MAHVVYITHGMMSPVHASFELSRRLIAAGHRVSYVSPADIEKLVVANGYPFHPLEQDRKSGELRAQQKNPWHKGTFPRPRELVRWMRSGRQIRRELIEDREIERLVVSLEPDLLLIDNEFHYAIIATAGLALPTLLLSMWFSIFRHENLPPMQFETMPPDSASGRLANRLAWWRTRFATLYYEWRQRLSPPGIASSLAPPAYNTVNIDDLRALAKSRGFDLGAKTSRGHWLRPFVYRHLPVICFNLRELDFPHEPHPNLNYVGPMVHRHRNEARMDETSLSRWHDLLKNREQRENGNRPLVYCSLGSYWRGDSRFLQRVIDVFDKREDWDLVVGLGGTLPADGFTRVPQNVTLLEWAPQLEVLEQADCAITHGGIATINECLACNVPMVVYSTKHVDQPGCAARVAFHGIGISADKDRDSMEQLEANIERVLNDAEIRANVQAMYELILASETSNQAVKLIEELI